MKTVIYKDRNHVYIDKYNITKISKTLYCNGRNPDGRFDVSNIGISYTQIREGICVGKTYGNCEYSKEDFIRNVKSHNINLSNFDFEDCQTRYILEELIKK